MAKDSSDNPYGPEHDSAASIYDNGPPSKWESGPDEGAWTEAQRSSQSPLAQRNGNADPKP